MARQQVVVEIDPEKFRAAVNDADQLESLLQSVTSSVVNAANSMSSGFRTGIYHDPNTGETVGDTQPEYGGDVADRGKGPLGLVHPKNYAAMKDNYENNTLLKAAGSVHV